VDEYNVGVHVKL